MGIFIWAILFLFNIKGNFRSDIYYISSFEFSFATFYKYKVY